MLNRIGRVLAVLATVMFVVGPCGYTVNQRPTCAIEWPDGHTGCQP